jgi:hypothetical protein
MPLPAPNTPLRVSLQARHYTTSSQRQCLLPVPVALALLREPALIKDDDLALSHQDQPLALKGA